MSVNPLPDFLKFMIAPGKPRRGFSERAQIDALETLLIKKRNLERFQGRSI
jgi:hypothetical protein